MDTSTGIIRPLAEGEEPAENEVELDPDEAVALLPLTPKARMAWWARNERGKDRTRAHKGQAAKAKAKRRRRR